MGWAVENGYVNGVSDTALAPAETATRAQIAAIAVRVQPEAL
ncbi:S-layer homology domain-containing protein [Slackia piriformis]|nr:S-layer homology domain-containing protein [Slackia piriformis]